jgi:hypothetical protein
MNPVSHGSRDRLSASANPGALALHGETSPKPLGAGCRLDALESCAEYGSNVPDLPAIEFGRRIKPAPGVGLTERHERATRFA